MEKDPGRNKCKLVINVVQENVLDKDMCQQKAVDFDCLILLRRAYQWDSLVSGVH